MVTMDNSLCASLLSKISSRMTAHLFTIASEFSLVDRVENRTRQWVTTGTYRSCSFVSEFLVKDPPTPSFSARVSISL